MIKILLFTKRVNYALVFEKSVDYILQEFNFARFNSLSINLFIRSMHQNAVICLSILHCTAPENINKSLEVLEWSAYTCNL